MIYKIIHRTTFKYRYPVSFGNHLAHLMLRPALPNQLARSALYIKPQPITCDERIDYFGNRVFFFAIRDSHNSLVVEARSDVTLDIPPAWPETSMPWEEVARSIPTDYTSAGLSAYQFTFESPRIRIRPEFAAYALESFTPKRPMLEGLLDLTTRIHRDFRFDSKVTNVRTTPEDVFRKRRGVCQDFAHVQIACLRSLNLPARYVSGYLRTYPPPGRPRLVGADASHAWVSSYCPGVGWVDLDPTNNVVPTDGHVTLAWGRDYGDVSPLRGLILGGGAHTVRVSVDVEPIQP
jgi:transglutaminase-like putative cysteine protease